MKLSTASVSFLSLVALATAAPLKASVWAKVEGGDTTHPAYRIGLAGAPAFKGYLTPEGVEVRKAEGIEIFPIADGDVMLPHVAPTRPSAPPLAAFASPPFVPEGKFPTYHRGHGHGHASKPCAGGDMAKSVAFANRLRKMFGLPPISEADVVRVTVIAGPVPSVLPLDAEHKHHGHKHHGHKHHGAQPGQKSWRWRNRPSAQRLVEDLTAIANHHFTLFLFASTLLAFVFGCGLGVLLRILYLAVRHAVRSVRAARHADDDDEYDEHETILTEEEQYLLPPPEYTDEKVALALQNKN